MSTTAAETTAVNDMYKSAHRLMLSDEVVEETLCSIFLYFSVNSVSWKELLGFFDILLNLHNNQPLDVPLHLEAA